MPHLTSALINLPHSSNTKLVKLNIKSRNLKFVDPAKENGNKTMLNVALHLGNLNVSSSLLYKTKQLTHNKSKPSTQKLKKVLTPSDQTVNHDNAFKNKYFAFRDKKRLHIVS